jgi:hypothetical protein
MFSLEALGVNLFSLLSQASRCCLHSLAFSSLAVFNVSNSRLRPSHVESASVSSFSFNMHKDLCNHTGPPKHFSVISWLAITIPLRQLLCPILLSFNYKSKNKIHIILPTPRRCYMQSEILRVHGNLSVFVNSKNCLLRVALLWALTVLHSPLQLWSKGANFNSPLSFCLSTVIGSKFIIWYKLNQSEFLPKKKIFFWDSREGHLTLPGQGIIKLGRMVNAISLLKEISLWLARLQLNCWQRQKCMCQAPQCMWLYVCMCECRMERTRETDEKFFKSLYYSSQSHFSLVSWFKST